MSSLREPLDIGESSPNRILSVVTVTAVLIELFLSFDKLFHTEKGRIRAGGDCATTSTLSNRPDTVVFGIRQSKLSHRWWCAQPWYETVFVFLRAVLIS